MSQFSLRQRLLLMTLLPSALMALVMMIYFTLSGLRALESDLHERGLSTVRNLAPVSEYGIIAGQTDSLNALVQAAIQDGDVKAAIIVSTKGRTLAVSGRVSLSSEALRGELSAPSRVEENPNWVAYGAPVIRSRNDTDPLFDLALPEDTAPEAIGHVFVEFDKQALVQRQQTLLHRALGVVGLSLLGIAALAITMANRLAHPLTRLIRAVRDMSAGQFETRVPTASTGELLVLEKGFNEMAEHIQEVHRSMQQRIEEATAQLVYQARHDPLTGLINRREFELRLDKALELLQAGGEPFSVLYLDLDRFKQVNDTCGHVAGDELLRQVALLLGNRLRDNDALARLGGDEFGVILNACDGERGRQVAHDLCALAGDYRFVWQDKIFAIGASIGLCVVETPVRSAQEVIAAADLGCQQAKSRGRNRVCEQVAEAMPERREDAASWSTRLPDALASGRLLIEALPLLPLQAGLAGEHTVELSGRLNEPGRPPIALSALMEAADRYDLASLVDRYFLEAAIQALGRAQAAKRRLNCIVPLSRASLASPDTLDFLANRLAAARATGHGLCLLIAEDVMTRYTSQVIEFARQAAALGCRIGLDDFGGGLSSFSVLRNIDPSHIKLSIALTRDLDGNRAGTALLRAVQEITEDQQIITIAEGIDELARLEQLRILGIGYAKGLAAGPREPFDAWLEGVVMRGVVD